MALASDTRGRQMSAEPAPAASNARSHRDIAFAQARRHSLVVRALKVLLPVATVLTLGSYGLFMQHSIKIGEGTLTLGPVTLATDVLTMHNPRYEGFNQDGGRFVVSARTAEQDPKPNSPVKLNDIEGSIVQANKTTTKVTAPLGMFDPKANELELFKSIAIDSSDGMNVRLTSAKVFMKEGRIISDEPVTVGMPTGELRGNSMVLMQKTRELLFDNGVTARLKPAERPSDKQGTTPDAQRASSQLLGANSDAPVDVSAPALKVDDEKKVAIFSDNVRAEQDGSVLTTRQLEVYYSGSTMGTASADAGSTANASGRLNRLIARDNVVLTKGSDRATSHIAEFDPVNETAILAGAVNFTSGEDRQAVGDQASLDFKTDSAMLTGTAVTITQGKNMLKGRRLLVDRKLGTMQLSAPAEGGLPTGRIAARFQQPETRGRRTEPAAKSDSSLTQFRTDPNAPIEIDADTLDVDDNTRTATFRGDVQAAQGDFTIRTVELIATYSGQAGVNLMQQPFAEGASKAPAQLQRVQARKKVVVTSKDDQSAVGDWADFDMKSNTVTLGGDVVLSQGRNVVRGPKLIIDMVSGQSRMEGVPTAAAREPADGGKAGLPTTSGVGNCGGRMCAVFYPKDAKDMAKRGLAKGAETPAGQQVQEAIKNRRETTGTGSSSWNSTTTPSGAQ